MSGSAITMMIIGMTIIWGGLIASVANSVIKAKKANKAQ